MKNSPSWRGRNVSEAVAIQLDCRAPSLLAMTKKNGARNGYCLFGSDEICY